MLQIHFCPIDYSKNTIYFIVANIKILGIMLISQLMKGSKEKFFINQIFDENIRNIRRLHQGKSFSAKNAMKLKKKWASQVHNHTTHNTFLAARGCRQT